MRRKVNVFFNYEEKADLYSFSCIDSGQQIQLKQSTNDEEESEIDLFNYEEKSECDFFSFSGFYSGQQVLLKQITYDEDKSESDSQITMRKVKVIRNKL